MIFQVHLTNGLLFQAKSAPPKTVAALSGKDFKDYEDARHQNGLKSDTPVNANSDIYKAAEKLLTREASSLSQVQSVLSKANSTESLFMAAKFATLAQMEASQNLINGRIAQLKAAKTAGEIDNAVMSFTANDPNYRATFSMASDDQINAQLDLFKGQPAVRNQMAVAIQPYRTAEAKALVGDAQALGPAATSAPTTAAAATPAAPKPEVVDMGINSEYEANVRLATNGKTAAEKRIGLRNSVGQEAVFLNNIADAIANGDKAVIAQLDQIEIGGKGFKQALQTLTAKYASLPTDDAGRAALSNEFRETLANYGIAASAPKLKGQSIPDTVSRVQKLVDQDAVAADVQRTKSEKAAADVAKAQQETLAREEAEKLNVASKKEGPSNTNIQAKDDANVLMYLQGLVDTKINSIVYTRKLGLNPKARQGDNEQFNQVIGTAVVAPEDAISAYNAARYAQLEIKHQFGMIPEKDYLEQKDFMKGLVKGMVMVNPFSAQNSFTNWQEALDTNKKTNEVRGLLSGLKTMEEFWGNYVTETTDANKQKIQTLKAPTGVSSEVNLGSVVKTKAPRDIFDAKNALQNALQIKLDIEQSMANQGR